MPNELQKIALITGCAVRVGRDIAEKLAQDGWFIALHYNSSEQEAYELARSLLTITNVITFKADLTKQVEAINLIAEVNRQLGPVSLLINNASIYKNDNLFDLTSLSLEKNFAIHINSVIYLAQSMSTQGVSGDILTLLMRILFII